MLAIVPSFVLFYLRYVSYVSFYCRLRAGIRLTTYDSLLSLHHTIHFNCFCVEHWSIKCCLYQCQKFLSSSFNTTHYSTIVITWIYVPLSTFVIYTILYSCKLTWCLPLLMRAQHLSGKSIPIKRTSNITRGRAQHQPMHLRYLKAVKFLALVPAQGLISLDVLLFNLQVADSSCRIFWWRSNCG